MTEGVLKFAADKIEELAMQELRLQTEVGKKVAELRNELEWLRTFLRDADRKRRRPPAAAGRDGGGELIEVWVRQTRELAHDAEDLLEEFIHEGELHCHGCFDLPSFLQWLRRSAAGLCTRHAIFDEIERINQRIQQVKEQRKQCNLEKLSVVAKPQRKNYSEWCELNETNIVEQLHDSIWPREYKDDIKKWILDKEETPRLTIVAFTGKSGIGKTSLAKFFYGRSYVRQNFDCTIWVHVPPKFRFVDLLRQIIDKAQADTSGNGMPPEPEMKEGRKRDAAVAAPSSSLRMEEESIKEGIAAALGTKRYLVVLDDVRTSEEWNFFLAALPAVGNGSCVIVTTQLRVQEMGEEAEGGNDNGGHGYSIKVMPLKKLETEEAMNLLRKRVYGRGGPSRDATMGVVVDDELTKQQIKEKLLEGASLPLNVVMLAGLLRSKKEDEWHDVIDTLASSPDAVDGCAADSSKKQKNKTAAAAAIWGKKPMTTGKILTACVDDLPPYLKPCFLYLAGFTAEAEIDARKLVRIWVAEGFLQSRNGQTMEERGAECLKELVSRCLVHLVRTDAASNIAAVAVHQTVLDFAQAEARDSNFLQVDSSTASLSRGGVRRLALRNAYDTYLTVMVTAPKLRSFICDIPESAAAAAAAGGGAKKLWKRARSFIKGRAHTFSIYNARFLRVMDLKGVQHRHTLPEEIGWLIHLRYLGLSHTTVRQLPGSVRKLRNLQTLDVSATRVGDVHRHFWGIRTLRHVIAGKLRAGPKEFHTLTDVQTLHGVPWGRWARQGAAIKRMTNLRSLKAWRIPSAAALLPALAGLECLRSLDLELDAAAGGSDGAGEAEFPLQELLAMLGLRQLQFLRLQGKVADLAPEPASPTPLVPSPETTKPPSPPSLGHQYMLPNLAKVELCESRCSQDHIGMLARLPNLAELVLKKSSYAGAKMVPPAGQFPKLKKLELVDLPELEEINVVALPLLHDLSVSRCKKLPAEGIQVPPRAIVHGDWYRS